MPLADQSVSAPLSRSRRARFGASCLGAVIACAIAPGLQARGFTASASVAQGAAQITTGANDTHIAVRTRQAVIDWTLDRASPEVPSNPDAPFPLLPAGATATFAGTDDASNGYTVLNRLLIPKNIGFSGTVNSLVGNEVGGGVWFFAPYGIVVGESAVFNVGSLVLTTNEIDISGGLFGADGAIRFRSPPTSSDGIRIDPGAVLSANGAGQAYLALVSSRVAQYGSLQSTGSIALVAADEANVRINAGLLDIEILKGTANGNGIIHTGTTGGPVSGAAQTIYMVAVPKNDAVTMLLSGTIGYQQAAEASVEGTAVVLRAGNVSSSAPASILIGAGLGDTVFTSPVSGFANTQIELTAARGQNIDFRSPVALTAGDAIRLSAVRQARIRSEGKLTLTAGREGIGGFVGLSARGAANPGSIEIESLDIDVSGTATERSDGEGRGGSALLEANVGEISIGRLTIDASGIGERGTGGDIVLNVDNAGAMTTANTDFRAEGIVSASALETGIATGGSIQIRTTGGALALGETTLSVDAIGRSASSARDIVRGGEIAIDLGPSQVEWSGIAMTARASAGVGAAAKPGRIALRMEPGGGLRLGGNLTARVTGGIAQDEPSFNLEAPDALLTVTGDATIVGTGAVNLALGGTGAMTVDGALAIESGRQITASGFIEAGTASLLADGDIQLARLRSAATISLRSASGGIVVSDDLQATGLATVSARSAQLTSNGSLNFAMLDLADTPSSIAVAGDLGAASADSSGSLTLEAGGRLTAGNLSASEIVLAAGDTIMLDGPVVGRTIFLSSRDIELSSAASLGQRGVTDTVDLAIRPISNRAVIGSNSGATPQSNLDVGEAARIFADKAITISSPTGDLTVGDLALSFSQDGNIGAGGVLRLKAANSLDATGKIDLTTVSSNDTLALSASTITLDPDIAGIALTGPDGSLRGRLSLNADTIIAATPEARRPIDGGAGLQAVTAALGQPVVGSRDDAFLRAGAIEVQVSEGFYVQNSGLGLTPAARRGFAAASLSITTNGAEPVIAINGTILDFDGSVITGADTANRLLINGVPGASAQEVALLTTVNGCSLDGRCEGESPTSILPPGSILPGQTDILRQADFTRLPRAPEALSEQNSVSLLDQNDAFRGITSSDSDNGVVRGQVSPYLIITEQQDRYLQNPLIDDPVTGVGNDDLWIGLCWSEEVTACSNLTSEPAKE